LLPGLRYQHVVDFGEVARPGVIQDAAGILQHKKSCPLNGHVGVHASRTDAALRE
jgi:hypothetical protein